VGYGEPKRSSIREFFRFFAPNLPSIFVIFLMAFMTIANSWLADAEQIPSPNQDDRPDPDDISLIVIHGISLPPGEFGGPWITRLFTNTLPADVHPYFELIHQFKVSAHVLIRRDGHIVQYVPFDRRAWHAGVSAYQGRERCNDFSVGIELEGTDDLPYEDAQYASLNRIIDVLVEHYPLLSRNCIAGHSEIAPGRKTDPGQAFEWGRIRATV
jgi:AmpD protein